MEHQFTNKLINSSSPYLLQHAHNPVNWIQWSENIVKQAKAENKLILISIGYAACHWCHVMERESFEDVNVARVMNENFVCVKVDREERPDVDNYYMTALQLMQQQGGWPLNVIAIPDGRPIWGGTYFPKNIWVKNLSAISEYYKENQKQTEDYAERLQDGINQTLLVNPETDEVIFDSETTVKAVNKWKEKFDLQNGGRRGAPKFPMPVNLDFLMYYGHIKKDNNTLDFIKTTLEKIARGGIYDQVGGGFARYSVDEIWKVPHFEKMLYDNAQLLSVYSKAYQLFKIEEFKNIVYETVEFLEREMLDKTGAFYSSLDADSQGEEGKFYVWSKNELKVLLNTDFDLFSKYFNINEKGYWENGNYILLRGETDDYFVKKNNLTIEELNAKIKNWKNILLEKRSLRVRPGLDDKTLTSWNALAICGLLDAYKAFAEEKFLNLALGNAEFIIGNVYDRNGKLFHIWKNGKASVDGFLEDYALVIQSFVSMYEVTGEEQWVNIAKNLVQYCVINFYDKKSGLFYFSNKSVNSVVTNYFPKEDNVIPSANSIMASCLFKMYLFYGIPEYKDMADKMLMYFVTDFERYPMAYANWGNLLLNKTESFFEVAVTGNESVRFIKEMQQDYRPNLLWAFSKKESNIPILKERLVNDKTLIYVCRESKCDLPVTHIKQAMEKLN